jgi:hypothetical protein
MPIPKHCLAALDRRTKAWRTLTEQGPPPSAGAQWHLHEGQEVQRLAREWLGKGTLFPLGRTRAALETSRAARADSANTLLFEATFEADGCVARAAAALRYNSGWC